MSLAREPESTQISTEETPRRHAPANERGILGWIHHNLFRTPLDAVLTIVSAVVIYLVVVSAIAWAVQDANWFAITRNLSLFMLGPLQADTLAVDNIRIMTLILAAGVGLSLAAWSRVGVRAWIAIAAVGVACLIVPRIITATVAPPPALLSAGPLSIVSGTASERPVDEFAFIASAGDAVSIALADDLTGDVELARLAAFGDRAVDGLFNASRARVIALERLDTVTALLNEPGLTDDQRAALETEHAALTASTAVPLSETYAVNSLPVNVRLLASDLETVIAEGVLTPESPPLTATLPDSGWYILQKTVDGDAIGLLETYGVYPHFERQYSELVRGPDGEILRTSSGAPRQRSVMQYLRMTDSLLLTAAPPRRDGVDIQRNTILDNQYRGKRPLADFLSLHVAPFLDGIARALIPVLVAVFAGYLFGRLLDRLVPAPDPAARAQAHGHAPVEYHEPTGLSRFVPAWIRGQLLWLVAGILFFVGIRTQTDFGRQLDLLGTIMVGLILVFVTVISGSMLKPAPGTRYSRRFVSWLWFVMPFIVFALVSGTDYGRWGGLFLTFMLTIVGIVASFPIGVLLALGRRADGLPAVKYFCIAFIETVRGVPLITVLFLASLALPLVSPSLDTVPQVVRAMVAITLFSAAYLAENVRGGLQSVPPGQSEAARALGMNPVQVTSFITLPQALRAVIPALVGQCIALFKDTSLVAIVGLLDLTRIADSVVAQAEYIGLRREVYVFISVIYFVFSYAMGYVSRKLEQSGSGSARQTNL